jgi:hypothetical protein
MNRLIYLFLFVNIFNCIDSLQLKRSNTFYIKNANNNNIVQYLNKSKPKIILYNFCYNSNINKYINCKYILFYE